MKSRLAQVPTLRKLRQSISGLGDGCLETGVWLANLRAPSAAAFPNPRSILVIRNNDLGDVLIVTPLFEALRRRFPEAAILAGVGSWAEPILDNNPFISEVVGLNGPWFNKYVGGQGLLDRLHYLRSSEEVISLRHRRVDIGIDLLGSRWGALLMLRARVPYRMGTSGYAGGRSAFQASVPFDPQEHVGRHALRFAEMLGQKEVPENRPQLYLRADEIAAAEHLWSQLEPATGPPRSRILMGPGGGVSARCWPPERFIALAGQLSAARVALIVAGGIGDQALVAAMTKEGHASSLPEIPTLRQVFALARTCDVVICNSSMLMHVAAAFSRPTIVVLGPAFDSAKRHQAQWGYPNISWSLGREGGDPTQYSTVDEVERVAHELIERIEMRRSR
jgi:ADP-heptose:LPS heptosyltransferase